MSGKGILGDILGVGGALLGGILGPEIGIPAALATGAGGFLGGTAGGVAEGEPIGQAALGGLETGAISGATAGIGQALGLGGAGGAGDITATQTGATPLPASAIPNTDISGITGGGGVAPTAGAPAAIGGVGGGAGAAAAPAGPGGGNFAGLATSTGGAPGDISASLGGTALPALGTAAGVSGPAATSLPTPPTELGTIAGAPAALPSGNIGSAVALGGAGAPTNPDLNFIGALDTSQLTNNAPASLTSPGGGLPPASPADVASVVGGGSFTPGVGATGVGAVTPDATAQDFGAGGNLLSRAGSYIADNPGVALAGGGLLASILANGGFGSQVPGSQPVSSQAGTLATQANQNINAVNTGNIPAGAQTAIDQAARSAKASTLSLYNSLGLGNSTVAQQAIAQIDQNVAAQKFDIAQQLVSTGISEAQLSSNLYSQLMNATISQDQNLQRALASFSGALAGGALKPTQTTSPTPTA